VIVSAADWIVAGLPVRVAAHGPLDSRKGKTQAVLADTPGFSFWTMTTTDGKLVDASARSDGGDGAG